MMPDERAALDAAHGRVRIFINEHLHGGCRMLSLGDDCTCPRCDVDLLHAAALREPVGEREATEKWACPNCESTEWDVQGFGICDRCSPVEEIFRRKRATTRGTP